MFLSIKDLKKSFGEDEYKTEVLKGIDFEIENRNPINCRESPKFSQYFNTLWRELGVDG